MPPYRAGTGAVARPGPLPRRPRAAGRRAAPCRAHRATHRRRTCRSIPAEFGERRVGSEAAADAAKPTRARRTSLARAALTLRAPSSCHARAPQSAAKQPQYTSPMRASRHASACGVLSSHGLQRQGLERGDGNHRQTRTKRQPLRDGHADPHPGEGARTDARGDAIEHGQRHARRPPGLASTMPRIRSAWPRPDFGPIDR